VKLQASATTLNVKPENVVFSIGTAVTLVDLTGAPELNGLSGGVEGFDKTKGRYEVRIEGKDRLVRARQVNCQANLHIGMSHSVEEADYPARWQPMVDKLKADFPTATKADIVDSLLCHDGSPFDASQKLLQPK
jgi:hypothetical protein